MPDTPNSNEEEKDREADRKGSDVEAIRAKQTAMEQELNNYKLRLADYENARKRLIRDVEVEKKYAAEPLAHDLLNVIDNLDRALTAAQAAGDGGPLVQGVSATATQFLEILKRHGITRIECAPGALFDARYHQAVMQQPTSEFEPGHVVQVLQQGFMLHDRVLRAASVIVAAAG
jgi:molecular chaperone GrpE